MTAVALRPQWAGQFETFSEWVTYASGCLERPNAVCVDALGRRCLIGADFMRARDEGTFPVGYFWDMEPDPVPGELDKWQHEADEMAQGMQAATRLVGHFVFRVSQIEQQASALFDDPLPAMMRPPHGKPVPSPTLVQFRATLAEVREDIDALMPASHANSNRTDEEVKA